MNILGGSSDHIIVDVNNCDKNYKVGDIVRFKLTYGSILSLMTSSYIKKYFVK